LAAQYRSRKAKVLPIADVLENDHAQKDLASLQKDFDAEIGRTRLLALLSPT
jgi:hypothetical protein